MGDKEFHDLIQDYDANAQKNRHENRLSPFS